MSEFDRARDRAERRAVKKQIASGFASDVDEDLANQLITIAEGVPSEPIPKAPKKRSNEIAVQVWIDGNEYCFTFKTNITGSFLGTQQSRHGMQHAILEALRTKFGAVELV